jgi:hypothetical protein
MTFAYMQGTIHPYYTVLLTPAIGALTGIGGVLLRQRRDRVAYAVLAVTVLVTASWVSTCCAATLPTTRGWPTSRSPSRP